MEPQSIKEMMAWEPTYPDAIIGGGVLYEESRGIMYGKYKSLKSLLAQFMALCIGDGREWLGFKTPSTGCSVLYLQIEMPHRFMKGRTEKMLSQWPGEDTAQRAHMLDQIVIWSEPFIKLDTTEGMSLLNKNLVKYTPRLLIVDPLYKAMSGNILDPNSVRSFLDALDRTISVHKCSIFIVSHTRKGAFEEWGSDDLLGSVFLSAWADSVIKVTRGDVSPTAPGIIPIKVNFDVLRHAEEPIEEMEVLFDSKTMLFEKVEKGLVIPI